MTKNIFQCAYAKKQNEFLSDLCDILLLRRPLNDTNDRKVVLRGNPNQIKMAKTFIEDIVRSLINERQLLGNHKQQPLFLTSDTALNGDQIISL